MLFKTIVSALLFCLIQSTSSSKTIAELKREILDQILPKHENDIFVAPGNLTSDVTVVETNLYVLAIDEINEEKKEISFRLYFRQFWKDHRLKYTPSNFFKYVLINNDDVIWTPDTFFVNAKKTRAFDVIRPNVLIRIFPDGSVVYSKKLAVTLNCPMDFSKFPFDRQLCEFRLESYGYTKDNIILKWKDQASVGVHTKATQLSFLELEKFAQGSGIVSLSGNEYDFLTVYFYLTRNVGYYVYQLYLPSIALVILSWLPFWMNQKVITSRLLISFGALLAYSILVYAFNANQPQTPQPASMLCFTGICLSFLVSSVIETVMVHILYKDVKEESAAKCVENGSLVQNDADTKKTALQTLIDKIPMKTNHLDLGSRFIVPFVFTVMCVIYFVSVGALSANEPINIPGNKTSV